MTRFLDIVFSGLGMLLCLPLVLVLVPVVRATSHGPAMFHQKRVGRGREVFVCHKIRTMATGTPQAGTHEISESSVTGVGRFLRRTKLDEIPQLWNVLKGEMSLVGPRPCLPAQEELIEERDRRGVFAARPGITGLAQVRGIDMSDPVKLADCDAEYLRTRSVGLYLKLIVWTVLGGGSGDKVGGATGRQEENSKGGERR